MNPIEPIDPSAIDLGDYSTIQAHPRSKSTTPKIYPFQKPQFPQPFPSDLHLESTYEENTDTEYEEEELKGEEALDNYGYKFKNMYRLKEKKNQR
jgi:hypothetical protein